MKVVLKAALKGPNLESTQAGMMEFHWDATQAAVTAESSAVMMVAYWAGRLAVSRVG